MDNNMKMVLKKMTEINIIVSLIMLMVLRIISDVKVGVAFGVGVMIYNICIIVKAYVYSFLLEDRSNKGSSLIMIVYLVIFIVAIGSLIFKGDLKAILSYCFGLTFNYVSMGYSFLRGERK